MKTRVLAVVATTVVAAVSVAGMSAQASASELRFASDRGGATPQIIGGSPASEEYPFMASLQYKDPNRPSPIRCGATLVSPRWLVTAAHCIAGLDGVEFDPSLFQVKIGSTDYQAGTAYQIERFLAHPWWGAGKESVADIGMIKLRTPAPQPFLDNVGSPAEGTPVRILGWGRTVDGDSTSIPRQLQELDSTILPYENCIHNDPFDITPGDLCVDAPGGTASICSGDSGGPLLYKHRGTWFFAGVASRSPGESGCLNGPPVFTSTSRYWNWIQVQALNDV